jgi:stage II sporulation protein D
MAKPGKHAAKRDKVLRGAVFLQSNAGRRLFVAALVVASMTAYGRYLNAQQAHLGHEDRATSLYRVVVSLDSQGHPLLPVSVIAGVRRVEVSSATGVRVIGTDDGSVEIRAPAGKPVVVTASRFESSVRRHYLCVARVPADDLKTLRTKRDEWRKMGHDVRTRGIGTTYALRGRALDTRQTVLCVGEPIASRKIAREKASALSEKARRDVFVHVEIERHPRAQLSATTGGVKVLAQDVLWFQAAPGAGGRATQLVVLGTGGTGRRKLNLPGRVYVVPDDTGGLTVVNEARIEKILKGVVASEIFASAPMEALKAQAVAARTDMLAKVGLRHRADPFSICSEVHCQAYRGTRAVSSRIIKAVDATRGMVLVDQRRRLIDAFYHAVSGGHTEHNENAWKMHSHPALRGKADLLPGGVNHLKGIPTNQQIRKLLANKDMSYAAASGRNKKALRWTAKRTIGDYRKHLAKHGIKQPVKELVVTARGVSGRAKEIELTLADGTKRRIYGELRIRRAFLSLRSSLFVVEKGPINARGVPAWWTFKGAGYGHGVGLDQTGSCGRAKLGQSFVQITGHYYSGSVIERLY